MPTTCWKDVSPVGLLAFHGCSQGDVRAPRQELLHEHKQANQLERWLAPNTPQCSFSTLLLSNSVGSLFCHDASENNF